MAYWTGSTSPTYVKQMKLKRGTTSVPLDWFPAESRNFILSMWVQADNLLLMLPDAVQPKGRGKYIRSSKMMALGGENSVGLPFMPRCLLFRCWGPTIVTVTCM